VGSGAEGMAKLQKPFTVLGKEIARTVHKIRLGLEKAGTKDLAKIKNNIISMLNINESKNG
jgi:hypothetical protein